MSESADVVVLGLGAMGSATLLELARRGAGRVVGIDRFVPPHDRGSSHGLSRLIRLCYYEHPDYVPLLRESYALWERLQAEARTPLLRYTGGLYLGAPGDPFVEGSLASARAHTLDHELLSAAEVRRRFPAFVIADDERGFYEPTAGVLFPERAIAANLDAAARLGAIVHAGERVLSWRDAPGEGEGHLVIVTDRRTISANRLVIAAGPWTAAMVPALSRALRVTRQVVAWFDPPPPNRAALTSPAMPAWAVGNADGSAFYGFPLLPPAPGRSVASPITPPPGGAGFKLALHAPGDAADPDADDRAAREADTRPLAEFLRARIPSAAGALIDARVCFYTSTSDQHFLIDLHPEHPHVVVVSACSGHGFKFAPVVGAIAADLATTGRTDRPIDFLRWR